MELTHKITETDKSKNLKTFTQESCVYSFSLKAGGLKTRKSQCFILGPKAGTKNGPRSMVVRKEGFSLNSQESQTFYLTMILN